MKKNYWKQYFKILSFLSFLLFFIWLGIQGYIFWLQNTLHQKNKEIEEQTKELEIYKTLPGFTKLTAVKELEGKYNEIPWSTHINKVITMLEEIKKIDQSQNETIILSDVNVDLEKIKVKGNVSNLLLLYYTNPQRNMISLIDKFKKLDFIENMHIKNYTQNENNFFSFVLEANVIKDGK